MATIDRRRNNGPANSYIPTLHPSSSSSSSCSHPSSTPSRPTPSLDAQKFFMRSGIIQSANGSVFYELGKLKVMVSVHGPRPASMNATYSHAGTLSIDFSFAPFTTHTVVLPSTSDDDDGSIGGGRQVDGGGGKSHRERVIGQLIHDAVGPSVMGHRYPKSEITVVVVVLETLPGVGVGVGDGGGVSELETVAGGVTATAAALADAGIEVYDLVAGAMVRHGSSEQGDDGEQGMVIGYMPNREEVTMMYSTVNGGKDRVSTLVDRAVKKAKQVNLAVSKSLLEQS